MSDHRKPPPLPFDKAPNGICRLCGDAVNEKGRRRWHEKCNEAMRVAWFPDVARRRVWTRDAGKCAKCGAEHPRIRVDKWHYQLPDTFQVDHVVPLYKAPRELKYWMLENLVMLCVPCHQEKSTLEASERAKRLLGEYESCGGQLGLLV